MKPYYVLVTTGSVDENGNPEKFQLAGADDPLSAETMVAQFAKAHRHEPCSIAVLQLYRNYPATLLFELSDMQDRVEKWEKDQKNLLWLKDVAEAKLAEAKKLLAQAEKLQAQAEAKLVRKRKKKGKKA